MKNPVVAFIGLPNSGKSTLLNRIIGEKKAVVANEAHTTRDVNRGEDFWDGMYINYVDTGGLVPDPEDTIQKLVQVKSWSAIAEADMLVWVIDRKQNPETISDIMLQKIWKTGKPFVIAINKVDNPNQDAGIENYARFGGVDFVNISAVNGYGLNTLLDAIVEELQKLGFDKSAFEVEQLEEKRMKRDKLKRVEKAKSGDFYIVRENTSNGPKLFEAVNEGAENVEDNEEMEADHIPSILFLGRPNVGKSSLFNAIFKEEKQIVTDIPGTTLSVNDEVYTSPKTGKQYVIIDSAGIRRPGQRTMGAESFATYKTVQKAYDCDVICFVVDASIPLSHQDQVVAGICKESHRGLIIVANKLDLLDAEAKAHFLREFYHKFVFLKAQDVIWVSAKTGDGINDIWKAIDHVLSLRKKEISREELRKLFNYLMKKKPPQKLPTKKKAVVYDLLFTQQSPPTFELLVKDKTCIHWSYVRFLENIIREQFSLVQSGLVVKLVEIDRKKVL